MQGFHILLLKYNIYIYQLTHHDFNNHTVFFCSTQQDIQDVFNILIKGRESSSSLGKMGDYFSHSLPLAIVVENEYIDKEWTSLLLCHYSEAFGQYPRHVKRVHFFVGVTNNPEKLLYNVKQYQDNYIGYLIIFPTRPISIGRTCINAQKFGKQYTLGSKETIHLAGSDLSVKGFPFSGQDGKVIRCAHAAIWCVIRYFNLKYGYYGDHYLGDIAKFGEDNRYGRSIPSYGLTGGQILNVLSKLRLPPLIFSKGEYPNILEIAKGYLFSGIPVILGGNGHAIVGIGLSDMNDPTSDIIANDDNLFPYTKISDNKSLHEGSQIIPSQIDSLFVPLYSKIVLSYPKAKKTINWLRDDSNSGLQANGITTTTIQRIFLTSSKSYKKSLLKRNIQTDYEMWARLSTFPKFIWVAEFSVKSDFSTVSAEYVLDATTSEFDSLPFLVIRYPGGYTFNNRFNNADDNPYKFEPILTSPVNEWEPFEGNLHPDH